MNLVFDFGAVLFKWQPAQIVASRFPAMAATPEAAQHLARSIFSHDDWHAFDRGTMPMDVVVQRTSQRLSLPHADLQGLVSGLGDVLTPIEETVAVLAALEARRGPRGELPHLKLYFLSNMPEPIARVLEQRHAFLNWFDGGIFSGDVKLIKPEPAIYTLLESRYALDPGCTVFIDDLKVNVEAARARNWHGIHFESATQLAADLKTHCL